MAVPDLTIRITKKQEEQICLYANTSYQLLLNQFQIRSSLEQVDRYYMREGDFGTEQMRARAANKRGDKSKIQDVTLPIIMPQVEAALGYLSNIFVTGYPTFGVSSSPDQEDAALQMETIVAENAVTARWRRQLIMFLRDGLKYNMHGLECEWQQKTVATFETDVQYANGAKPVQQLWKGNVLRRMDLYNTTWDPRVHPAEIHEYGEFAGYTDIKSRVGLIMYMKDLFTAVPKLTAERALASGLSGPSASATSNGFGYYIPMINPSPLLANGNMQSFDWMAWAAASQGTRNLSYTNVYEVFKLYARIVPADWGFSVPDADCTQVWKFIIVNRQVVICAERLTNAHNHIPIYFGQPLEDGLDYQTKSFASNLEDMQDIGSALWNGYLASKRRLVGDRVIYDPLRIREKDINSDNPAAKIPVRPSAYGKTVSDSVYQFPYRDEQTNSMVVGAEAIVKMSNLVSNQNPAAQGQFVKGNKTRHEYADVMGHSNAHNQLMGLTTEDQIFTPLKECIKLNILQYQDEKTIYNPDKKAGIKIDPVAIRKAAVVFKMADGLFPTDKLMSGEEMQVAMQQIGTSPALAAEYNIAPMFSYLSQLRGVDLRPFEKTPEVKQYEQALQAWQNAAAGLVKQHEEWGPEEVQKALGPMPQPPKPAAPEQDPKDAALQSTQGA